VLDYLKSAGRFTLRHWPTTIFVGGTLLLAMTTNILERFFVYYPMKEIFADPSRFGLQFDDVRAVTEDGVKVHGWFVPKPGARFTFLVFHGNAGNISHRLGWIRMKWSTETPRMGDHRQPGETSCNPRHGNPGSRARSGRPESKDRNR